MEVHKNVYTQYVRGPKLSLQFLLGRCVDNFKHNCVSSLRSVIEMLFFFPDYIPLLKAYLIFVTYIIFLRFYFSLCICVLVSLYKCRFLQRPEALGSLDLKLQAVVSHPVWVLIIESQSWKSSKCS